MFVPLPGLCRRACPRAEGVRNGAPAARSCVACAECCPGAVLRSPGGVPRIRSLRAFFEGAADTGTLFLPAVRRCCLVLRAENCPGCLSLMLPGKIR